MRLVLIGTVELSASILMHLVKCGRPPMAVVTRPSSDFNADFSDLEPLCREAGIECIRTTDVNSVVVVERLRELDPDAILVVGLSQIIGPSILAIPKLGVIGYHPALLPRNRGRHPLIWAIVLGLDETGSTFFRMDEGADSGDIVSQRVMPISYDDDARSLYDRAVGTAIEQVDEILGFLDAGFLPAVPQDEGLANYWRKRGEADGAIDWRMSAESIRNLVRGLTRPYVGAHFVHDGRTVKVWKAEVVACEDLRNVEPGRVLSVLDDSSFVVKAGDDCVRVIELEPRIVLGKGVYL